MTGYEQDLTALSSICKVQAPQAALPHPNFVPFKSRISLMTQRRGAFSSSTLTVFKTPFTVKEISIKFNYLVGITAPLANQFLTASLKSSFETGGMLR